MKTSPYFSAFPPRTDDPRDIRVARREIVARAGTKDRAEGESVQCTERQYGDQSDAAVGREFLGRDRHRTAADCRVQRSVHILIGTACVDVTAVRNRDLRPGSDTPSDNREVGSADASRLTARKDSGGAT